MGGGGGRGVGEAFYLEGASFARWGGSVSHGLERNPLSQK